MSTVGERKLLLDLIEQIGKEWGESQTAEAIRLDDSKIAILLDVAKNCAKPDASFSVETLKLRAPEFCSVFETVFLRKIGEQANGSPDSG